MKRSLATLLLLLSATTLFAREANNAGTPRRAGLDAPEESVRQLLYALPAIDPESDLLELRIVQGNVALITETIALPFEGRENATVSVLRTHSDELTRMRAIETEKPGSLRFVASVDGRVITDAPFATLDELSASPAAPSIIGETRTVKSRPAAKLRLKSQAWEPSCVAGCEEQYSQCLEWCDPRGSECATCYEWYNDCLYSCPQACSEPKDVTTYTTRVPYSYVNNSAGCFSANPATPATLWYKRNVLYQIFVVQRTHHCDGSYTDQLTGTQWETGLCWFETTSSCTPRQGTPPTSNFCY